MINVAINYYTDKFPERQSEIDFCFQQNMKNENINLIIIHSQQRLTYKYYFDTLNSITGVSDINIIANADIYFDDTIKYCESLDFNTFYALSRWDVVGSESFHFCRPDSQDVWAWKGKSKNIVCDYFLGMPGCDNRLAHEAKKAGYNVLNPSKTIKCYHFHNSNLRNYNRTTASVPGPYMTVEPICLIQ
jgi:hypothetical protein